MNAFFSALDTLTSAVYGCEGATISVVCSGGQWTMNAIAPAANPGATLSASGGSPMECAVQLRAQLLALYVDAAAVKAARVQQAADAMAAVMA